MRSPNKFKKMLDFLWKGRKEFEYFNYPDYGGVPKKIAETLSCEMVDTIQSLWEDLREGLFLRKRDFERELYSSCENFGEPLLFTKEEALY